MTRNSYGMPLMGKPPLFFWPWLIILKLAWYFNYFENKCDIFEWKEIITMQKKKRFS